MTAVASLVNDDLTEDRMRALYSAHARPCLRIPPGTVKPRSYYALRALKHAIGSTSAVN